MHAERLACVAALPAPASRQSNWCCPAPCASTDPPHSTSASLRPLCPPPPPSPPNKQPPHLAAKPASGGVADQLVIWQQRHGRRGVVPGMRQVQAQRPAVVVLRVQLIALRSACGTHEEK